MRFLYNAALLNGSLAAFHAECDFNAISLHKKYSKDKDFTNEVFKDDWIVKETKAADLDKQCNDDEEYPTDADKTKCREDNKYQVSQYDCSNDFISVAKQWDPTTNPNQGYPGGQCCYVMAMNACEPNSIVNFYEMYYCMFKGSTLAFLPISVSTILKY